jgi:hypothetical protein
MKLRNLPPLAIRSITLPRFTIQSIMYVIEAPEMVQVSFLHQVEIKVIDGGQE